MTIEQATQKVTGGELEYARQYYRQDSGSWQARFLVDIQRFSDKQAISDAVGVWLALVNV